MKGGAFAAKSALLGSVSCIVLATSAPASAQTAEIPLPPVNSMIDERGVDLASGQLMVDFTPLSIGDPANGLKQTLYYPGLYGFRHDQMITATADDYDAYGNAYGYHVTIATGKVANGFTWNGSAYVSDKGDGATLTGTLTTWTYTDRDGNVVTLDRTQGPSYQNYYNTTGYYGAVDGVATTITRPDGFKKRLQYKTGSYAYSANGVSGTFYATRLQSTTTSTGYQLKFNYRSNTLSQSTANDWVAIADEKMINNSVDYCDPAADTCTGLTQSWPTMTVAASAAGTNSILAFTDPGGRTSSFTFDNVGRIVGYRRPNASSDTTTYGYFTGTTVISSVALSGVGTWNYSFLLNGSTGILNGSVTTPSISTPLSFSVNYAIRQPLTVTNENGQTTTFTYDSNGRVKTRTLDGSGSNFTTYNYDARGNLTSTVATPKSGSGLATLTASATYLASCTNAATCNKPVTTTNSEGQTSNYFYNTDGTPDYVQLPAPSGTAARPETHFTYTSAQAQVKNASGTLVSQGDNVTLPSGTVTCATGAYSSCAISDQIVTSLTYSGATASANLRLASSTVKSGSGTPSATTSLSYDNLGNVTSVTDPAGNVSTTTYGADSQPILAVGPSLDGSSTSNRRAVQYHYNADGIRDSATTGVYNPNTQTLTARVVASATYDTQGRKTQDSVSDGSTTYAVTQYSYNAAGRPDCTAVRMNPSVFSSLPSACTASTQGSYGPDRIARVLYDNAGQVLKVQAAYGTSNQIDEVTYTYTNHGRQETMADAKGNLTSFVYDGHDRLLRTCYQGTLSACQGATSSDYVQLGYNAAGRLTSRSLRGSPGSTIGYTYDFLGRVTNIAYPGGGTYDQPVTMTYDNLGRRLSATDAAGHSATFTYDALGNVLSQGDATSARTMLYDAAGRRTRLTWSDGRYVTYTYDGASDLTSILESGTTALATIAYDDAGRRQSITFGNGAVKTWGSYTPLGPGSIALNLAGTASDVTFGYTYNPAGQIVTRTSSNDAYAYALNTGRTNVSRDYTANALNQYTASGSVTPTYDARGNLTSAGGPTYSYSTKNELTTRSDTGATFYRDPLGRLDTITLGAAVTKFQYDGAQISAELNSSNVIQKRFVWGAGADEALVWYEGADFASRRYLLSDERGSVVAVSDSGGNALAINTYDEYGIPGSGNLGRFQYTGQALIAELGMYDYKARTYSPTMGRFLQTDPAGYPDGPNWYAYVRNDPVNGVDPLGLDDIFGNGDIVVVGSRGGGSDFGSGFVNYGGFAINQFRIQQAIMNAFARASNTLKAQIEGGRQTLKNGYCDLANTLPANDRVRVGGDAAAGFQAYLRGGLGLSIAKDGSIWGDVYGGLGIGFAAVGGVGASYQHNAPTTTQITATTQLGGGVGPLGALWQEGYGLKTGRFSGGNVTAGYPTPPVPGKLGYEAGGTLNGEVAERLYDPGC